MSAIAFCHSKEIYNFTIAPDYMFFNSKIKGEKPTVKLLLFPFTQKQKTLNHYFLAPEIRFDNKFSHKSDVYSCGAVLYFLLSGLMPPTQREQRPDFSAPEWEQISEAAKSLVSDMLTPDLA
jgi:serine/threonine protein kinase